MQTPAFVLIPATYPPALDVLGVQITVLAERARTGGYEITLQQGAEGAGPPPHRHAWHESFFVLDGEVEITLAGETVVGRPGALLHVPAGVAHGYRFGAGGGRMLEISQVPAQDAAAIGATRMFGGVARGLAATPLEGPGLVRLLAEHGVQLAEAA